APGDRVGGEALLAGLERLDVVGGRETARAEEAQEAVQPSVHGPAPVGLLARGDGPRLRDVLVDGHRLDPADSHGGGVINVEVREDQQVADRLGHPPRPWLPVSSDQGLQDRLNLRLVLLVEGRLPERDRPTPRRTALYDGVSMAEVTADAHVDRPSLRASGIL